jgi:hemerythrin
MYIRTDPIEDILHDDEHTLVVWSEKYATGIELIDAQHKELVKLTNELYRACVDGREAVQSIFKEALSRMVDYVHFHFTAELELLARINYPEYAEHKKQHEELVQKILEASKMYDGGRKFIANKFVRTLRDWVFGHIAIYDKEYAAYVAEQKAEGLLSDEMLGG